VEVWGKEKLDFSFPSPQIAPWVAIQYKTQKPESQEKSFASKKVLEKLSGGVPLCHFFLGHES